MKLIRDTNCYAFPPRLPEQPIFYPVLSEEYAVQIARDWNAKDPNTKVGFVTRLHVNSDYLSQFEVHTVGSVIHKEYWIPAKNCQTSMPILLGRSKASPSSTPNKKRPAVNRALPTIL